MTNALSPSSGAQPLTLAAGDFDQDGVQDLVSGFAAGTGGSVTISRGNVNALWPYGPAARSSHPVPFYPSARNLTVPEAPDFLATGDFNADGHLDVVTAKRGSHSLYLLRGDGHGGLNAAKRIPLTGNVTALLSGEINRADGLADLIVAVNSAEGPRVLIFESPLGALNGSSETFNLPAPANSLALGRFNGTTLRDLAVAAGNNLVVIGGRDRRLSISEAERGEVAQAKVTVQSFPFVITSIVTGDFTAAGPGLAALDENGSIHILEHAIDFSSPELHAMLDPSFEPTITVANRDNNGKPGTYGGVMTPGTRSMLTALRTLATTSDQAEWSERNVIPLPAGFQQTVSPLIAARISGTLQQDLLVSDAGNSQVHVLSTLPAEPRANSLLHASKAESLHLLTSLQGTNAPAAVLPMRLNQHGLDGLVILQAGQAQPTIVEAGPVASNVFTVTNTSDAIIQSGIVKTGPDGSLRKAIADANAATGPSSIVFNIPTSDPNYNPATGTFLIRPLSESVPGAFDNFALPPINATMTIDGYTQPGASPNTLKNGDNAKILIQIDGSLATTPGGAGLVPFDDVGSTFRGLAFTGWTNGAISNGTESGAEGIEANGVGDFIEGNFFGTDPTGTSAHANRIGVFADNGPAFGNPSGGTVIGGTTPQARNLLSGNQIAGALFLAIAYEAQLQGNFVGTDITGTKALPNNGDGTGLNGPTIVIGGTLPGASNLIAGNLTNVDINDLTNINMASNSTVQGNLIGTDVTGAKAISGSNGVGVSILNNPTNMLIGGTTPAARNIISGNSYGVYVFDNSFFNVVQGNYIGLDITGATAIPNLNEGFISGSTVATQLPAGDSTIGGSVAGAGNVISGNAVDGIRISGTSNGPNNQFQALQGNVIEGNLIGTDATGKLAVPNQGNGVALIANATNNVIGTTQPGTGNLIAYNKSNGVSIDPSPSAAGQGVGNTTTANTILSNGAAGVQIVSGTANRISKNSIFGNSGLGIDLGSTGPNANTHCNATNTGANNSQNAPVLTAGTGTAYIAATATDPNGNTSEFSNAVKSTTSGNILNLLGSFDSTPSTTYTIEFFSSTAADPSGFGQGQTYLGSTTVSTDATCSSTVSDPVDPSGADVSVTLTDNPFVFLVGPDFGQVAYTSVVSNDGPATASNVVFTDVLPTGIGISSGYCNEAPCLSPVTTTLGVCSVSGQTVTCNLGAMPPGTSATIVIPVQVLTSTSIINTVTAHATETDPKPANNTASTTIGTRYPFPFIDHLDPTDALINTSGGVLLTIYGTGLIPQSQVSFNGTTLPVQDILDNQLCGNFTPSFCTGLQVQVPASLLSAAATVTILVTNPDPGPGGGPNSATSANFKIDTACVYTTSSSFFGNVSADGSGLIADTVSVGTNVPSCPWTVVSSVPWAVVLDHPSGSGYGVSDIQVGANTGVAARSGTVTIAGQTLNFSQDGGSSCPDTLSATTATIPVTGANGSVNVTTGSSCSYFVSSYAPWITIPQSSGLLVGSATASYIVAPNPGGPRTGTVVLGGSVLTVNQDAASCYFTLDKSAATVAASGSSGTIAVTASAPNCAWTATSSDPAHLAVTSGASGTGDGQVKYTVPVNPDGPQTPTITVGSGAANAVFTANIASAFTCTFSISPTPRQLSASGGSDFFTLTASFSFCKWTANSSDTSAISVSQSSGTGTTGVYYTVGQNTGGPRTLTIVAGCQIFTVNQDGAQTSNPAPTITTLLPASAAAGSGAFTLTVNGSNFINGSVVNFNGVARATSFVSATQLTAAILAGDVATAGTPSVTVTNPTPGGGTSNAVTFTVTSSNNPVPAITTLQPATITAGSSAFTLTINGSNFVSTSVVTFNGVARSTTYVSATQLTASILASDVTTAGTPSVTVTNPTPGGGTSNAVNFTITAANNPVPAITTLQPASAIVGSGAFTLTVNGSNFISNSVVNFNGAARTTTYVSSSQLSAAIPASDIAATGSASVTVTNPTPGGGTSNAVAFAINNPAPAITSLQPSSVTAGAAAFTLIINGSGFNASSAVSFGGAAKTTTLISPTQLTVPIAAADVATAAVVPVLVTNSAPGGGSSSTVNFTITAAGVPQASLTPPALTFPNTNVATTSSGQTVTLSNNGNAALSISAVAISGSGASSFAQTNTCGSSLAAGSNCSIVVTFTPATAGALSAQLAVTDNATGSPQQVTLSGTGVVPPAPIANLTPTTLNFSAVVGTSSAAQTATLANAGNAPLTITGITLGGSSPGAYSQTNNCGNSLAAGASCSISITFSPLATGTLSATLSVADNATGSPQSVSLTGSASAAPSFTVTSSTATQTVPGGGSAQYTITVAAQNGTYANPVTLSASGLPTGATATFAPSTISPGSSSASSQLTIQTPVTAFLDQQRFPLGSDRGSGLLQAALLAPLFGFFVFVRRVRKSWVGMLVLLLACAGFVTTLTGCGGGFPLPGSGVKTYTVTITGTSGTLQQSTTVQLIVK